MGLTLKTPCEVENIRSILAIDCGSTTTKAILIEKCDDEFRLVARGEAPTTVESPVEDVTIGVLNAISEIQKLTGRRLLTDDGQAVLKPHVEGRGVDLFVSTSSAGGGLQMVVTGVVKNMTGESAMRAALGAGGIVMDVIAANDGRLPYQKIERIRQLRPDMILLAGGTDGGATSHVAEIAEMIASANPRARLGSSYKIPILFAGNIEARSLVGERLNDKSVLEFADNLRPSPDKENPGHAREKIQELFLDHVMKHAPGYAGLMGMTDYPLLPTPKAVGDMMRMAASKTGLNILGVDIGGATTDVFSVFNGLYNKTVSANLGMSYSLANVVSEAGLEKITRWLPFTVDEKSLLNGIMNKMIRPTTIPATLEDLIVEHACAREALRLSFVHHKTLAVELKGVRRERTVGDVFNQTETGASLLSLKDLGILIGSGGVLSHAPRRQQAAMMLIDAFLPEGVTKLAVDSIFMMPQLGVLSKVHEKAALSVFERDCLIPLGTCIAPIGNIPRGEKALSIEILSEPEPQKGAAEGKRSSKDVKIVDNDRPAEKEIEVKFGDLFLFKVPARTRIKCRMRPSRNLDLGIGPGIEREAEIEGGEVGIIIDARGRPLEIPEKTEERISLIQSWCDSMDLYPEDSFSPIPSGGHRPHAPSLMVSPAMPFAKDRRLPIPGEVRVKAGDKVRAEDVVASANLPGKIVSLNAPNILGCEPGEIDDFLKKHLGERISKDETIGETPGILGYFKRELISPSDGIVENISKLTGQVFIREPSSPIEINAYLDGIVSHVFPGDGARISTNACFIQGIFGFGPETSGKLAILETDPGHPANESGIMPEHKGTIVVSGTFISAGVLRAAVKNGVKGVISGGINASDLLDFNGTLFGGITGNESLGITLIITEGFGQICMAEKTFSLLKFHEGKRVSIDGATQIRAGVIRPEIIIPISLRE